MAKSAFSLTRTRGGFPAVLLTLLLALCPAGAEAGEKWDRAMIEALFPAPADGWRADDMEMAQLEIGEDAPDRIQLARQYRKGENAFEMGIDTANLILAATIRVLHTKEEYRTAAEQSGKTVRSYGGYPGFDNLKAEDEAEKLLLISIGQAGVIAFSCTYAGCGQDIEAMIARLDFPALIRFANFDHGAQAQ